MIQRMLAGGLIAGFAAGLLGALLHFAFVQELILLGEEYETGALVHFAGVGEGTAEAGHDHAEGEGAQDHTDEGGDGSALMRNGLTVLFTGLIYAGYGLILVAGFALAEHFGRQIRAQDGILWGIGAFVAFQLAPAMGLAPELPGTIAADLGARQVWWWGTVLATGTGLALLAYGRNLLVWVVAGALLAAPHVIGAPELGEFFGSAPPEVAAAFSARVLGVGLAVWAVMGWLAGRIWARDTA
ncbi:CbtA family protein [Defluviimonas aestuarii]|uniref:CbtA family protein n=1 Tax=Albidovulum aestuarii TaxID=1130726 RepID=UPI00249BB3C8|nr:CbtA family protein [Defluviimonas aestuarii]MDI3337494.1 CbtA family protein [Defluviimonas aestuarii]